MTRGKREEPLKIIPWLLAWVTANRVMTFSNRKYGRKSRFFKMRNRTMNDFRFSEFKQPVKLSRVAWQY